jgi:hypothetical protein
MEKMISKKPFARSANDLQARALARWESEGGALAPVLKRGVDMRTPLSETEVHVLQCLGAAVLLQWNDLPAHIQRQLFKSSTSAVKGDEVAHLKEQIARFLHEHKDDERSSR